MGYDYYNTGPSEKTPSTINASGPLYLRFRIINNLDQQAKTLILVKQYQDQLNESSKGHKNITG